MMSISQKIPYVLVLRADIVHKYLSKSVSEILFRGNTEYRDEVSDGEREVSFSRSLYSKTHRFSSSASAT